MMQIDDELSLLADADRRSAKYLSTVGDMRVFPDQASLAALNGFDEVLPQAGHGAVQTLDMLDRLGSPATVASNGPRYFGFVIGASLPAAAAADRLAMAWDQCASSFDNSPAAATIEAVAGKWIIEILDLPREAAVGFGTSATACTIGCLATARRTLLARQDWDVDAEGLAGAPPLRVVASASAHVTISKALRILGFGLNNIEWVPVDGEARVRIDAVPVLDNRTIFCLQAGEVNTGEFDRFSELIGRARAAGAWTHVDGAFGLWARASAKHRHLTEGVEGADSWTTDGHKWLNTPYDGAMAICRDGNALAATMNSNASYATASADAQKNLTLEFSRRPRGVPIWAALRSLGCDGVVAMIEQHIEMAQRLAEGLAAAGYRICNRVVINQVLVQADNDEQTIAIRDAAERSGEIWFSGTIWQGRPAFRLSVSSWRTTDADIERAISELVRLKTEVA